VEAALREVDELTVLVYDCPEVTDIPLGVRAGWIRNLFPSVRVVEAWDGPREVGDAPDLMLRHEEYVIRTLGIRGVTHFYSSEFYGAHMSRALGAVDRRVDEARTVVPVSATAIRSDPYGLRRFLHPLVYRDFVTTVVFLGAPSTGKTSIAERMAREYRTVWMPEYGREYWEARQVDRRLSPDQLVEVADGHLVREDSLLTEARRYLFVDTNALTTRIFARHYHGESDPRLEALADRCISRYNLVFLCDTDIPYQDTPDRSGPVNRDSFQRRIIDDLSTRRIRYHVLSGDPGARAGRVEAVLRNHRKFDGAADGGGPVAR
jgi:NadR type nicotinamide-nucleotide adenylyltransferase